MCRHILSAGLLLTLAAFPLAGCADPVTERDPRVELEASASVVDDVLIVEGSATVPDGARIDYQLDEPLADLPDEAAFAGGNAIVSDESFTFEEPVTGLATDEVNVWISFQTPGQPVEIVALYGEAGENIESDNVVEVEDIRRVEIEFTVPR